MGVAPRAKGCFSSASCPSQVRATLPDTQLSEPEAARCQQSAEAWVPQQQEAGAQGRHTAQPQAAGRPL